LKAERALRGAKRRGNPNLLRKEIATLLSVVRNDDFPRWGEACVFSMHPSCLQMILIDHGFRDASEGEGEIFFSLNS